MRTYEDWQQDKDIIIKGIALRLEQVERGSLSLPDLANGVMNSLLAYQTDDKVSNDEVFSDLVYSELFSLCGPLEVEGPAGYDYLNDKGYLELKKYIQEHSKN